MTGTEKLRTGGGEALAHEIRERVKFELGITVSVGVSYNKIYAKLGSDYRKPDAVTVFSRDNFKEKIWPLPASDLLYVGPATARKLRSYGIYTIGQSHRPRLSTSKTGSASGGLVLIALQTGRTLRLLQIRVTRQLLRVSAIPQLRRVI